MHRKQKKQKTSKQASKKQTNKNKAMRTLKTCGPKDRLPLACSRRSDSGARAKIKASERPGKKRGETAPLSERLEQANYRQLPLISPGLI